MTAAYNSNSYDQWYNYTKLYYTDYIGWKIPTIEHERNGLITELVAEV